MPDRTVSRNWLFMFLVMKKLSEIEDAIEERRLPSDDTTRGLICGI